MYFNKEPNFWTTSIFSPYNAATDDIPNLDQGPQIGGVSGGVSGVNVAEIEYEPR